MKKPLNIMTFIYLIFATIILYFLSKIFGKSESKPTPENLPEVNTNYNSDLHPRPYQAYIQFVNNLSDAINGLGTDVDTIENVFTSINPFELQLIHEIYLKTHDESLASALRGELGWFNDDLEQLIIALYNEAGLNY